jgi:zinc/manganese transport system ATP-binding protein
VTAAGLETTAATESAAAVELVDATLAFGDRVLWRELNLSVQRGEFLAVLGPNGSGKSSLLRVLLGQVGLSSGSARVAGREVRRGSARVGYIPQQRPVDTSASIRGRDLVRLGLDGHRWGLPLPSRRASAKVAEAIGAVDATSFADAPLALLSGGEQQRLRIAQALVNDPAVLLCDEPLLSLDLHHQRAVTELIDRQRHAQNVAVLFVTHEINPVLPMADRVLYLVGGRARIGTPDEVMRTEVLSQLYDSPVQALRHGDRIVVLGGDDAPAHVHEHHDEELPRRGRRA